MAPSCDASVEKPTLDVFIGGAFGIVSVIAFHNAANDEPVRSGTGSLIPAREFAAAALLPTVAYALSATYGFYQSSRCRDARRTHAGRSAGSTRSGAAATTRRSMNQSGRL
jgi:hypothetical protein